MRLDYKILEQLSLSTPKTFEEIEEGLSTGFRSHPFLMYDEFALSLRIHLHINHGLIVKDQLEDDLYGFRITNKGFRSLTPGRATYTGQPLKASFSPRG